MWRLILIISVTSMGLLAGLYFTFMPPGYIDFYLHTSKYENVIRAVKSWPITPGETKDLWIDRNYNPDSLRDRDPHIEIGRGEAVGLIRVARSHDGQNYAILIFTTDHGHAGLGGYVYQDASSFALNEAREPEYTTRKINKQWSVYTEDGG